MRVLGIDPGTFCGFALLDDDTQIALSVWPNLGERPHWQQAELLRDVQEVLDGRAAPCVSRTERDAIKAEAKRLSELGS
jgi:hypothetical protein